MFAAVTSDAMFCRVIKDVVDRVHQLLAVRFDLAVLHSLGPDGVRLAFRIWVSTPDHFEFALAAFFDCPGGF